jgi:Leucine-rich repeat (LRR) protein
LAGNEIKHGLSALIGKMPLLEHLDLSNNMISNYNALKPLVS